MIRHLLDLLAGRLSAPERIWSALAPLAIILSYVLVGLLVYPIRARLRGPYRDAELATRGSSVLIGMPMRHFFAWITQPIWFALRLSGIPATALTTLSVLLATAAAIAVGAGRFALGGWLYVSAGLCDFFDGRIARATGRAGPAGEALDSVLDRYSDSVFLLGLAWYYRHGWVLLATGALMIGTSMVPYIRARGDALGVRIKVGLMQRPERMLYLGISVALSPILEALYSPNVARPDHHLAILAITLIAISTLLTAAQRLIQLLRALEGAEHHPAWMGADRGSLFRFAISSTVATAADFALVLGLVAHARFPAWVATFVGCGLGALVNFAINRWWAFSATGAPLLQMSRYGFVSATSALLNAGGVAVLLVLPGIDYRIAWLIARGAVFLFWNFPLNRDYVFAPQRALLPSSADTSTLAISQAILEAPKRPDSR